MVLKIRTKRAQLPKTLEFGFVRKRSAFAKYHCRHHNKRPETKTTKVDRLRQVQERLACFPKLLHFVGGAEPDQSWLQASRSPDTCAEGSHYDPFPPSICPGIGDGRW